MNEGWRKKTRLCPKCKIAHDWTPFCPLCGYEYKSKVLAETANIVSYGPEDESEAYVEEARRPSEFFIANPAREYYAALASPVQIARYDARRPHERRVTGKERTLLVVARKIAEGKIISFTGQVPIIIRPCDLIGTVAPECAARDLWERMGSNPETKEAMDMARHEVSQ